MAKRIIFLTSLKFLFISLLFHYYLNSPSVVEAHSHGGGGGEQPLSKIAIHMAAYSLQDSASIKAYPLLLGTNGEDAQWITVELNCSDPTEDDWVGVFSPAKFNSSVCLPEDERRQQPPYICSAPIKYRYANDSNSDYTKTGNTSLKFQLINQRADFSFALFSGGLSNPKLVAISNVINFANPKAPLYPRLSQGKSWNEMTVTWTTGYNVVEAVPFVEWGLRGEYQTQSPAGTLTFHRNSMCERDGSKEYRNYQPGSLNTTDQLIKDINNIDIVFHIGDITYANRYISQWDQFTPMVEPIASTVPYMIARYSTDYGMFRFCIADTEHDWREGSEQYRFIENCLASADRQKQPWLIFAAHRVLGYSSGSDYGLEGSFEEPMGRESLQKLWQKYKVDLAFYGHVHNYERTCPIYQNQCVNTEKSHYSGTVNGTIHVVVGGGGSHLSEFNSLQTDWSLYRDYDYGFVKMTAFNHSSLLFEYKKSSDGIVYDSFTISRECRDVLACVHDGCEPTTLAS